MFTKTLIPRKTANHTKDYLQCLPTFLEVFYTYFNRTIWSVPCMEKWQPDTPDVMIMSPWWTLFLSKQANPLSKERFPPFFKLWSNNIDRYLTCLDSTSSFCAQFVKSFKLSFLFSVLHLFLRNGNENSIPSPQNQCYF